MLLDGANTFRAETVRGYVDGIELSYLASQAAQGRPEAANFKTLPINLDVRFRYKFCSAIQARIWPKKV